MNIINAVTIGKLIAAHREGDEEIYPSTGKNRPRTAAVRLLTAFAFRTLLVDSFRQAALFCCLQYRKAARK